jgi:hypothetical protein
MTAVVAVVMRSGCVFSGGAAQTSWATWGGGDVMGHRAVMITHARAHGRFSVAGPAGQRRKLPPALMCAARGVFGGVAPLDL